MNRVELVVVEGYLEVHAARRLMETAGVRSDDVLVKNTGGCEAFWREAGRYNEAARDLGFVFGLTDLDDNPCASGLIARRLGARLHPNFILRIQVRELESWLLADSVAWARYLAISEAVVPKVPDQLPDPKQALVNLVRRCRRPRLVEDIVPEPGRPGPVGPGYTPRMVEFIKRYWDPNRAAIRSPSLTRALAALRKVGGPATKGIRAPGSS